MASEFSPLAIKFSVVHGPLLRPQDCHLFAALGLVATAIAATMLFAFLGSGLPTGVLLALSAAALGLATYSLPRGEAAHLATLSRPMLCCIALPTIWMIIQVCPIPVQTVSNPIWVSTEAALGVRVTGSISVDPGATLVSNGLYLSMVAMGVATAAISINRRRAEIVLFGLVATAFVSAMGILAPTFLDLSLASDAGHPELLRILLAICALGVPIAAAACGHALELRARRLTNHDLSVFLFALTFACSLAALCVCSAAIALDGSVRLLSFGGCGFATVLVVTAMRHLAVGRWFIGMAVAIAIVAVAASIGVREAARDDLIIRYANASSRSIGIASAMLADSPWPGSGAGAYTALSPFYQQSDDTKQDLSAPTTAAEFAIELGKPALWALVLISVSAITYLIRGSLIRGRDSYYSIAAAGAIVVFTLQAFYDATGSLTPVGLLVSAILGLGVAQSMGRSMQ